MKTKVIVFAGILLWALIISSESHAGMKSAHFRLNSSIISGGSVFAISTHYQKDATLGQPTPLMNSSNSPYSVHHDLYPGFWYALGPNELSEPIKSLPWLMLLLD